VSQREEWRGAGGEVVRGGVNVDGGGMGKGGGEDGWVHDATGQAEGYSKRVKACCEPPAQCYRRIELHGLVSMTVDY